MVVLTLKKVEGKSITTCFKDYNPVDSAYKDLFLESCMCCYNRLGFYHIVIKNAELDLLHVWRPPSLNKLTP